MAAATDPQRRSIPQRLVAACLGLVAAFLVLELSLRIGGALVYPAPDIAWQGGGDEATVLCIGDSFTAGKGDASYPAQLDKMLNAGGNAGSYRVINAGMGGYNTTMILEALPGIIESSQPDLAILLAGTANHVNYYGYGAYLRRSSLWSRADQALFHVRSFRLFRYALTVLRQRGQERSIGATPHGQQLEQRAEEGSRATGHASGDLPTDESLRQFYLGMHQATNDGDPQLAVERFEAGIEADPTNFANYFGLGTLAMHQARRNEAISWYKACIKADPAASRCIENLVLVAGEEGKDEVRAFLEQHAKRGSTVEDYLLMMRVQERKTVIAAWVKQDLEEMVDLLLAHGAEVILHDYPNPSGLSSIAREVAAEKGVRFVTHEARFQELLLQGHSWQSLFVPDGHCNELGYRQMAFNLYEAIMRGGYFAP